MSEGGKNAGGLRSRVRHADLHAHTVVSDGTLTPTQLVELAAARGLAALAITDHDHVGGLAEARRAGARLGVEVVSGIELSVTHEGADVHVLGYLLDDASPPLLARLEWLRAARERRAVRMVERLVDLGVPLTMADVAREAAGSGGALGRPHVARALVTAGHASSIQDAFDRWLGEGRPAAVPKEKLGAVEAIALVHAAGGVAVLAHAVTIPQAAREGAVRAFAAAGLDGLEVDHPKHDDAMRARLRVLAAELSLVPTGGSDYHGANKPDVELGSVRVPYATLDALRARAARRGG